MNLLRGILENGGETRRRARDFRGGGRSLELVLVSGDFSATEGEMPGVSFMDIGFVLPLLGVRVVDFLRRVTVENQVTKLIKCFFRVSVTFYLNTWNWGLASRMTSCLNTTGEVIIY